MSSLLSSLGALPRRVFRAVPYKLKLNERLRGWEDGPYLELLYLFHMGRRLNLEKPATFTEKQQWLKLHDRRTIYTTMVDKYESKLWVSRLIGPEHVVPTLGVWNSFDEIDFDLLPDQFVLKTTHDSGGVVVCEGQNNFDLFRTRQLLERALARNYYQYGREWPYRDVKPRILAEVYIPSWVPYDVEVGSSMPDQDAGQLGLGVTDYKFYCFHGEPRFLSVSQGSLDSQTARRTFLHVDWTPTEFTRTDYRAFDAELPKPTQYEQLLSTARTLSAGIPFVRVDLFEHMGRVLFSEMTFTPTAGMSPLVPKSADREIGEFLDLSRVEPGTES